MECNSQDILGTHLEFWGEGERAGETGMEGHDRHSGAKLIQLFVFQARQNGMCNVRCLGWNALWGIVLTAWDLMFRV